MVFAGFQRALLLVSLSIAIPAYAEPGVTDSAITLGQSAPFTGPVGTYGVQMRDGANVYFQHINKTGGVNGRKIELVSLDDGYEETRAVANTKKLIEENKVFALFGYYGTASTNASMKVFTDAKSLCLAPLAAPHR